jgi:hypothetical protein
VADARHFFDFPEIPRAAGWRNPRPASGIAFARDGYRCAKPQDKPNFTIGDLALRDRHFRDSRRLAPRARLRPVHREP